MDWDFFVDVGHLRDIDEEFRLLRSFVLVGLCRRTSSRSFEKDFSRLLWRGVGEPRKPPLKAAALNLSASRFHCRCLATYKCDRLTYQPQAL